MGVKPVTAQEPVEQPVPETLPNSGRRNILLVSFDDAVAFWRYKSVFGEALQTPNLDRICAQSTAFHAAYCQAPVCAPSRASFLTGKTPHQLGVFGHDAKVFDKVAPQDMWPYLLKQNGYFCSSGGKVHHGFRPLPPDIHEVLYSDAPKHFRIDWRLPADRAQKKYGGSQGGTATTDPADDGKYHDAHAANSAIDFLQTYAGDQPFYREVGFYGPHSPFITPARFKDMYNKGKIKRPRAWAAGYDTNAYADEHMPENTPNRNRIWWRNSVRNYFSALSHADYHLGRVWDALQASPFAQDTVVVILSDHGFHLGEKNRFRKMTLWEQVAAVPLIIHDPHRPQAREIADPVALIDVGPTVLDYAAVPGLDDSVGQSLRPLVEGQTAAQRAIPTVYFDSATIRQGDYRIIRYADGSTQLFDLQKDWWQLKDLGPDHPAFSELYASLIACCRDYGYDIPDGPAP